MGDVRWSTPTQGPLPFRHWDGDYVVFNPLSGNTHILDIVSGRTLTGLFAGPRLVTELSGEMALFLDVPDDDVMATEIERVLQVLDELGLAEAREC